MRLAAVLAAACAMAGSASAEDAKAPKPAEKSAIPTLPAPDKAPTAPAKPATAKPASAPAPVIAPASASAPAPARAPAHAAPAPAKKPLAKLATKTPARPSRTPDPVTRHLVAGGPTVEDAAAGAESPELRALRDAERELFPTATAALGEPWPTELASPLSATEDLPLVHASGLPPPSVPSAPPVAEGGRDLSWLGHLTMPDLPIRWDARVVRYLEFFKDDPRGRKVLAIYTKRAGRYGDVVRRTLRRKGVPEDLMWLAMIESTFDATARSAVGARGLWQFMTDTAKAYGLPVDRWADERMNPEASTEAAADFLSDLHRRFGSWDLAMAAYNMGYWGVAGSVRKYNTNDYWALARVEGGLPWETTLYVPKILAAAVAARNPKVFGIDDLAVEPALDGEPVDVQPGTALASVAAAAGCTTKEIEQLNPELRASRTPPATPGSTATDWPVRVPRGRAQVAAQALAKTRKDAPLERYVVRFGESLEQIAAARHVPLAKLVDLNAIAAGEVVRGGTVLLVPASSAPATVVATPAAPDEKAAIAVVPSDIFVYPDRRRVFYRVLAGDTIREIADTFHVTIDELRRWNDLDPTARLQDGMTIQLFVPSDADLSHTVVLGENDVRVLPVGSEEFFAYWESLKGRKRITVTARDGETLASIGNKYGMTPGMMERINHRGRAEHLTPGDAVVVYVAQSRPEAGVQNVIDPAAPAPNGPLPDAPMPEGLPEVR